MTTATQPSSQPHKNYVGGAWVEGAKIAEDINPSDTNDVVGQYTYGDAGQANAAVTAAKDAFLAWSRSSIQLRHDILKRVGDEILARRDELGRLLSREEGKTLAEGVGEVVRAGQIFLFFSGECLRLAGDKISSVRPGVDVEVTREPVGVVGVDHALEFSHCHSGVENRPSTRLRQLRRPEAGRSRPGNRSRLGRHHRQGGYPAGRVQSRNGSRIDRWPSSARKQGRRGHFLHRLGRHGPPHCTSLHRIRSDEEDAARDGWQEPDDCPRRCRSQDGGRLRCQRRVLLDWPALHGFFALDRDARDSRSLRGCRGRTT